MKKKERKRNSFYFILLNLHFGIQHKDTQKKKKKKKRINKHPKNHISQKKKKKKKTRKGNIQPPPTKTNLSTDTPTDGKSDNFLSFQPYEKKTYTTTQLRKVKHCV